MKKQIALVWIAAVMALLLLSSCGVCKHSCCSSRSTLAGAWQVETLFGDKPEQLPSPMSAFFNLEEAMISCQGVCNSIGGRFQVGEKNSIAISNLMSTRVACPLMGYEGRLVNALQEAHHYKISRGKLYFYNAENKEVLKLSAIKD